jgi:DNA (cytosine-5)-methyltransferase 1
VRPVLLDLFCGAGGAAMGYHRAGFDVVGVDLKPQPRYPFTFYQADALQFLTNLDPDLDYDAIHASPPCQHHSVSTGCRPGLRDTHPNSIPQVRAALEQTGNPWIIENVPGAPIRPDYRLCGCMFGLHRLRRDRWFETSWRGFDLRYCCSHPERAITVAGHPGNQPSKLGLKADWVRAMGIDWMTAKELAQAIPPAYTEYVGGYLIREITPEMEKQNG